MKRLGRAVVRHARQLRDESGHYRAQWAVERELERLLSRGRTIIVGPWLSEVGYETLYWIPFLRWVQTAFRVDAARVVAVSRGGVSSWYHGVAGWYVDIWDDMDPAEFSRRNAARGALKQLEPDALDREILANVRRRVGDADVLHPSMMYRLFSLYWSGHRAMSFVDAHTRYAPVPPPRVIDPAVLPREYVAIKFYAARSTPATQDVRARIMAIVRAIAVRTPVVLLDTGLTVDDHVDHDLGASGQVVSARPLMTPGNNLAVQTQIIAGARAFVGTCGSVAWLAPWLGVPTSAVYVDPKWLHAHLAVALRAYHRGHAAQFAALDLRALEPLHDPMAALA